MTTFSKGLMIALSLCLLLALNASFAQEDSWETVAVYMVDPIDEKVSLGVREYVENLTWETFKRDFTPAREAQLAQVEAENEAISRRCRKEFHVYFMELLEIHDQSLVSVTAPRIISFTVRARTSYVEFDYDSIRLLQPAVMDPDESVIDLAPYWKPAAKATASAKASSWGRIKATFADD